MNIADWLVAAKADAEARGLPELVPMLDGLAQATERLRNADWNDNADQDPIDSIESEDGLDLVHGKPSR